MSNKFVAGDRVVRMVDGVKGTVLDKDPRYKNDYLVEIDSVVTVTNWNESAMEHELIYNSPLYKALT